MREKRLATWDGGKTTWGGRVGAMGTVPVYVCAQERLGVRDGYWREKGLRYCLGTPTEPHHTPSLEAQQTSPTTSSSLTLPPVTTANISSVIPTAHIPTVTPSDTPHPRPYTRRVRIAQSSAFPPVVDEPASPLRDVSQGKACSIDSGFVADHDRENIAKTSTLPSDLAPRVTSLATDEGSMQQKLDELMALCTSLQRQHSEMVSRDDAPIKGRSLDQGEEVAEKGSNDREEMINVLTSIDATTVLSSGVAKVPTGSGSIPTTGPPATGVPTVSDVVPTTGPIFTTATLVTPYTRRKGKEKMIEDAEIARIYVEEELQIMIDGLDRSNETVAKYLQEYHQFAIELPIERRIELISDLVRYQDNYAKAGWKAKDFKGMTLEEIKENFDPVWKQIHDFIPIGLKEEAERFKRKGISSASYQFFVDMLKHLDREDLNQLWRLVKESLSIRPAASDKEMELWVELKRIYKPDDEDQL
nr:hypothetical protein [Tanacetum cinerariifolium]